MILIVKARTKEEALGFAKDKRIPAVFLRKPNGFDQVELACPNGYRERAVQWYRDTWNEPFADGALLWYSMPKVGSI
jgi:hypothetical protein